MLKKIVLIVTLFMFAVACGGKSGGVVEDGYSLEAIRALVKGYSKDFCGNKAFVGTKKAIENVDRIEASGDINGTENASNEAIKVFSKEEPPYKALLAERKRTQDLKTKLKNMDRNSSSNNMDWRATKTKANKHLQNAKKASDACNLKMAQMENNRAQDLIGAPDGVDSKGNMVKYTVVRGDNLWNISKRELRNAYLWPVIYWGNKDKIKDPDLIFPGQVFGVSKNASQEEKRKATRFSRTRGKWSLYDKK